MPSVLNIKKRFARWRHGKGFGIHSPFAYRFVTETLRQQCAYYAYSELHHKAVLRLVVRLVASFKPRKVYISSPASEAFAVAVHLADSRVECLAFQPGETTVFEEHSMLILDCRGMSADEVSALFSRNPRPHALLFNLAGKLSLADYGMTFRNNSRTVVVTSYPHLPRQDFEVKF